MFKVHLVSILTIALLGLSACTKSADPQKRDENKIADIKKKVSGSGNISVAESGDPSKSISGDSSLSTSGDNSKATSTDKTVAISSDISTAVSKEISIGTSKDSKDSSVAKSDDHSKATTKADTQTGTERKGKTKTNKPQTTDGPQFMVRIEALNVVEAIQSKELLVLMDNALQTRERAMHFLMDRGAGIFCDTEITGNLRNGDILPLIGGEEKVHPEDKTMKIVQLVAKKDDTQLTIICTHRGGHGSDAHVRKNFDTVISFSDNTGKFGAVKPPQTPEEIKAEREKRKTFKILNDKALLSTQLKKETEPAKGFVDGKVVDAEKAMQDIMLAKAEQICRLQEVKGSLQKNKIYSYTDTQILDQDRNTQTAFFLHKYKADAKNELKILCFFRMSTLASEIFKTFQGVLEFGAKK